MKRWLVVILVVILLTACSNSPTAKVIEGPQEHITITAHSYDPLVLYTEQGTTVTWTNKDSEQHTVTLLGIFDSGTLGRRHQFSYTFTEPGTYKYTDLFDEEREGKVIVK